MHQATYELLEDDGERGFWLRSISNHRVGTFYGEIIGFAGVYANSDTLEACRELFWQAHCFLEGNCGMEVQ